MNVIGVSAFYHDSAACLVRDGTIVAAVQEEAFSRIKHDAAFPTSALRYCLAEGRIDWSEVDAICYYELPHLKRARVNASLRASGRPTERGVRRSATRRRLRAMFPRIAAGGRLMAIEHHLSHAASAFYPSPFEEAAVLTVDGVGEYTATSIGRGRGHRLELLEGISFPHSLGLFYAAFTSYCGFPVNSGEYKLMGLAAYGRPRFSAALDGEVIRCADDGSYRLNMKYFSFLDPDAERLFSPELEELLGRPARVRETELDQFHADVAESAQQIFQRAVVGAARRARSVTGATRLVMAGGGALNCVANTAVQRAGVFDDLWIQPGAGDAGASVGAALYASAQRMRGTPVATGADGMQGAQLGPGFSNKQIRLYLELVLARFRAMPTPELVEEVADLLAAGKIVGWFRGRTEFGPRALGNRSILADPRRPEMKRILNEAVKYRELFRPFAPAVLQDDAARYFNGPPSSPYMLFVADVVGHSAGRGAGQLSVPGNHRPDDVGGLPAITHVDGTARVQTVDPGASPEFASLIRAFGLRTGVPVLVNTSFNLRGEPIVCTPEDAVRCFLASGMDFLAMGDHLLDRRQQDRITVDPGPRPPVD